MENFNLTFKERIHELLSCNTASISFNEDNAPIDKINKDLELYINSLNKKSNYLTHSNLETWIDHRHDYPTVHPHHQKILDVIKEINPASVCELGAGAGQVSKYVYAANPEVDLTCVEFAESHYKQMLENFDSRSSVLNPDVKVKANTINASAHNLKNLIDDDSQELVYTCTLVMHLPYLIAISVACEIARISSKYVLHIENPNDIINTVSVGDVKNEGIEHNLNRLTIDYKSLYEKLGFECVFNDTVKDPYADCNYVYFLAKKK